MGKQKRRGAAARDHSAAARDHSAPAQQPLQQAKPAQEQQLPANTAPLTPTTQGTEWEGGTPAPSPVAHMDPEARGLTLLTKNVDHFLEWVKTNLFSNQPTVDPEIFAPLKQQKHEVTIGTVKTELLILPPTGTTCQYAQRVGLWAEALRTSRKARELHRERFSDPPSHEGTRSCSIEHAASCGALRWWSEVVKAGDADDLQKESTTGGKIAACKASTSSQGETSPSRHASPSHDASSVANSDQKRRASPSQRVNTTAAIEACEYQQVLECIQQSWEAKYHVLGFQKNSFTRTFKPSSTLPKSCISVLQWRKEQSYLWEVTLAFYSLPYFCANTKVPESSPPSQSGDERESSVSVKQPSPKGCTAPLSCPDESYPTSDSSKGKPGPKLVKQPPPKGCTAPLSCPDESSPPSDSKGPRGDSLPPGFTTEVEIDFFAYGVPIDSRLSEASNLEAWFNGVSQPLSATNRPSPETPSADQDGSGGDQLYKVPDTEQKAVAIFEMTQRKSNAAAAEKLAQLDRHLAFFRLYSYGRGLEVVPWSVTPIGSNKKIPTLCGLVIDRKPIRLTESLLRGVVGAQKFPHVRLFCEKDAFQLLASVHGEQEGVLSQLVANQEKADRNHQELLKALNTNLQALNTNLQALNTSQQALNTSQQLLILLLIGLLCLGILKWAFL